MQNKITRNIAYLVIITALVLSIPYFLNWPWTMSDFVIMGILIFVTGLTYVLVTRNMINSKKRKLVGAIILFVFLLIWIELAVGIFGSPFAGS